MLELFTDIFWVGGVLTSECFEVIILLIEQLVAENMRHYEEEMFREYKIVCNCVGVLFSQSVVKELEYNPTELFIHLYEFALKDEEFTF